ncbi:MAG: EamA family transporter, partial [Limisphaerales bacterium]
YRSLLATSLCYGLGLVVLRETDVNVTAMTILMQPVAGVPVAVLWLGEPLHAGHLWGSLAIILGLVIGLYAKPAKFAAGETR